MAASSSSSLDSSSLLSSALAAAAGLAASSSSEESSSESESDASAAFYIHQYVILWHHSTSTHDRGRDLGGRNSIRARVVVRLFLLRVRVFLGRAWLGCGLLGSLLRLLLVLSHVRRDPEWTTRMGQIEKVDSPWRGQQREQGQRSWKTSSPSSRRWPWPQRRGVLTWMLLPF